MNSTETPADRHRRHSAGHGPVGCAVITVSDTRTEETDTGGRLLQDLLQGAGHRVLFGRIVRDEPSAIRAAFLEALRRPGVEAVFFTGGTGIALRDHTVEAVRPLLDAELPGFGELFRMLSFQEIGAAALLSRATAGRCAGVFVACLPGSPAGVKLAVERLLLPELRHVVWELQRHAPPRGAAPEGVGSRENWTGTGNGGEGS